MTQDEAIKSLLKFSVATSKQIIEQEERIVALEKLVHELAKQDLQLHQALTIIAKNNSESLKIMDCFLKDYAYEITKTQNLSPKDVISRIEKCSQESTELTGLFVVK